MGKFSLHKVIWRDGDVITENHFKSFEKWVENLIGISSQYQRKYGLYKHAFLQDGYNSADNIIFHMIDESQYKETQYRIDIERFQAINPMGHILKIDERRSFNLRIQFSKQSEEGFIIGYLTPVELDENNLEKVEDTPGQVTTDTTLYHDPCALTTSNENRKGVPILRFKLQGGHLDIDNTFIPFGLHIDSSQQSADAHNLFAEKFKRFSLLLNDYLHTLRPTDKLMLVWNAASGMHKATQRLRNKLVDPTLPTEEFFSSLQEWINLSKAEITILSIGYEQDYLRQKSADTLEVLEKPVLNIIEQQYDLTLGFQRANTIIETMMKYLEVLPAGPVSEKALPVQRVEFSKVAGSNKLKVYLDEEVEFKKGETQMTIYLRSYTNAEPVHKNVRVSLGDVSQAMLKDLRNALKPITGETLSYRIECPKEIINRDSTSVITIYVPTPIGENVPDLERYLTINIRE